MDQQQFTEILTVLKEMITALRMPNYTITGAADWPILLVMMGVVMAFGGVMWRDLRSTLSDKHLDLSRKIDREISDRKEGDDQVWAELRRCKEECVDGLRKQSR